jgi:hypothetical protein
LAIPTGTKGGDATEQDAVSSKKASKYFLSFPLILCDDEEEGFLPPADGCMAR